MRMIGYGADLTPPLGGPTQRIARLGTRWAVDVTLPRLDKVSAQAWIAAFASAVASAQTVNLKIPGQPDLGAGTFGGPMVNGAGQSGSSLAVRGFNVGYTVPVGTFFHLPLTPFNLYCTTAAVTADGSGHASLPIAPMIRASPADGVACGLINPRIEGFLPQTFEWDLDQIVTVGMSFTITEVM